MKHTTKSMLKPGSIALGLGLLTSLCQAQQGNLQGAPSATPMSFQVPPHALSAISFSTTPNAKCSVAPARGSDSEQGLTVFANDEGTATFYVTPSQESSSAAQLVATCSSGNHQKIEIQRVAGAKPLVARPASDTATQLRLGHTVRPALMGDPMALPSEELMKRGYPMRPDPQKAPGAYSTWLKAVSKPSTFISPKTVNMEGRYHGPVKASSIARDSKDVDARESGPAADPYGSNNWSGYALSGLGVTSPFTAIEGDWNVPQIVGGEANTSTHSSYWIGIDGFNTSDVVQDGTNQDVIASDGYLYTSYWPWKEICCQETEQAISNFSVHPGDEIYSMVWMADANDNLNPWGGYGYFYFEDVTTGQYTTLSTRFNSGNFYAISAEWIMERPSFSFGLPDLSDYSWAVMRDPWAYTMDGSTGYGWVNYLNGGQAAGIYQIDMYNGNDELSTVYPIDSNSMVFYWLNYH
jgi:hypothetical protein